MAGRQEVMQLLDRCGAKFLGPNHHRQLKYRLPNRRVLTLASSPSDHRSWDNCLADVRRELRDTHPALSKERSGYTPPKSKLRHGGTSIGALLTDKHVAIEQFNQVPAAEFTLESDPEDTYSASDMMIPEHKSPRIKKDPPPAPSLVRTLSPQQLDRANEILRAEGDKAMNKYICECRAGMILSTPEVRKDRIPASVPEAAPVVPPTTAIPTVVKGEDDMITEMVERAEKELNARQSRIMENRSLIEMTQRTIIQVAAEQIESDELAVMTLSDFINDHRKLHAGVSDVLQILPAIQPVPGPSPTPTTAEARKENNQGKKLVRIDQVVKVVLPALSDSEKTWDTTMFHETLVKSFPDQEVPLKGSCPAILTKLMRSGNIERVVMGQYRVKAA